MDPVGSAATVTSVLRLTSQTVVGLARGMGLHRQGVQRIVNELEAEGIVEFLPNPGHRRAHLVALTRKGQQAYAKADAVQIPWANDLARGIAVAELSSARDLVVKLRSRLEADRDED